MRTLTRGWAAVALGWGLGWTACGAAPNAPYTPKSDAEVVERLPQRMAGGRASEWAQLRARWRAEPSDPQRSAELAQAYFQQALSQGDPRFVGYAQAALQPWWTQAEPPTVVRLVRGMLKQYNHQFEAGLSDLKAVAQAEPDNVSAWAWMAAVHMVMADYDGARQACERTVPLTVPLASEACKAHVESMTGEGARAAQRLQQALAASPGAPPELKVWALTRLGEVLDRLGQAPAADAAFQQALKLGGSDVVLLGAYSDFLLDQGRGAEVLKLLKDRRQADTLLLRLVLAAQATQAPEREAWAQELAARFEAARAQGDARHEKEEARLALLNGRDVPQALALARHNFETQREAVDARVLLEAAVAARQPAAAEPVLAWRQRHRVESVAMDRLVQQLQALAPAASAPTKGRP